MTNISAGFFTMGDASSPPQHTVHVSAFYIDKFEVTGALWSEIYSWALTNGYSFDNAGSAKGPNHPVHDLNWFDIVKWCNARSQKENRMPAYYLDATLTQVYTTGQKLPFVNWNAGYRLPTEAEWERAARGGVDGQVYPWGDILTHEQANFDQGFSGSTTPVGSFPPNGFGVYDTVGNIYEWCWDWNSSLTADPVSDPRGPDSGTSRSVRGGDYVDIAITAQTGRRSGFAPDLKSFVIGFRCAFPAP